MGRRSRLQRRLHCQPRAIVVDLSRHCQPLAFFPDALPLLVSFLVPLVLFLLLGFRHSASACILHYCMISSIIFRGLSCSLRFCELCVQRIITHTSIHFFPLRLPYSLSLSPPPPPSPPPPHLAPLHHHNPLYTPRWNCSGRDSTSSPHLVRVTSRLRPTISTLRSHLPFGELTFCNRLCWVFPCNPPGLGNEVPQSSRLGRQPHGAFQEPRQGRELR